MTIFCWICLLTGAMPLVGDDTETLLPIEKAAAATIDLKGFPDFLEIGLGSVWVSNPGIDAVQRIDGKTNQVIAEVKINKPCAAMAAGYDSLWVASCKDKSIFFAQFAINHTAIFLRVSTGFRNMSKKRTFSTCPYRPTAN